MDSKILTEEMIPQVEGGYCDVKFVHPPPDSL